MSDEPASTLWLSPGFKPMLPGASFAKRLKTAWYVIRNRPVAYRLAVTEDGLAVPNDIRCRVLDTRFYSGMGMIVYDPVTGQADKVVP